MGNLPRAKSISARERSEKARTGEQGRKRYVVVQRFVTSENIIATAVS
jgi:hypothetical protein